MNAGAAEDICKDDGDGGDKCSSEQGVVLTLLI